MWGGGGGCQLKGYTRLSQILKKKRERKENSFLSSVQLGKVEHVCNLSIWEAKAGRTPIPGQSGYRVRPYPPNYLRLGSVVEYLLA